MSKITFVIPVVHPNRRNVTDYALVEQLLAASVRSYLSQSAIRAEVLILCHQRPDWPVDPRINFVLFSDVRILRTVQDKGIKYFVGASMVAGDGLIMLADADDFARHDLGERALDRMGRADGVILKEGYHALIDTQQTQPRLGAVFRVRGFSAGCGTCRVFRAEALAPHLRAFSVDVIKTGDDVYELSGATKLGIQSLLSADISKDHIIRALGRHGNQSKHFNLKRISGPLAAKGCGHGNHAGHRSGDVHWHMIGGLKSRRAFCREFGVDLALAPTNYRATWQGLTSMLLK